ncbi:MAG: 50S ribosomal protein L11 methyltransferase [Bernardetiaceae bacterium]|nr:50S ribosomal protein L11 methyltransferase [Bernardetiaceae bacterium]
MQKHIVFDIKISEQWADALQIELSDFGFDAFLSHETGFQTSVPLERYEDAATWAVLNRYKTYDADLNITQEEVAEENWNKKWESNFEPIRIDKQCLVRADFHPTEIGFDYEILITPKMAFGTGHHQTTKLVLKYLLDNPPKDKTVLDAGCGTAILGILAKKMGAKSVFAYDIEEISAESSRENAEQNQVAIDVACGTIRSLAITGHYDLILANINRNVLLDEMEAYCSLMHKASTLVLSGFYAKDVDVLMEKANSLQLNKVKIEQDGDWTCLVLSLLS